MESVSIMKRIMYALQIYIWRGEKYRKGGFKKKFDFTVGMFLNYGG